MNHFDFALVKSHFLSHSVNFYQQVSMPLITAAACSLLLACGGGSGGGSKNSSSVNTSSSNPSSQVSSLSSSPVSSLAPSSTASSAPLSSSIPSSSSAPSSVSSSLNSSSSSSGSDTAATLISTPGASYAKVTIDDQGNLWAVWRGFFPNANGTNLIANRYIKGQGWGNPLLLEDDGAEVDKFELYTDPLSGRTTVIWTQLTSAAAYDLWARRYDPATGWAAPERIENTDSSMGLFAKPVTDSNGKVIAVWSQQLVLGRFSIVSSIYSPGSGWSTPQEIEDNNVLGGQDGTPSLALLSNGEAIAVWLNSANNRTNIATNIYSPTSGWGSDQILIADTGGNMSVNYPEIINDGNARALLAWGQWDSLGGGTFTSRIMTKTYSNGWQEATVAIGEDAGSDLVSVPQLTSSGNGAAAVTWARKNQSVMVNTRATNGSWGEQQIIKPGNADFLQSLPRVALDTSGNGLLVWSQESNDNTTKDSLFSSFNGSAGNWSSAQLLENFVGTAVEPVAASNSAGDRVVVWYNINNAGSAASEIYARYFPAGVSVTAPSPQN